MSIFIDYSDYSLVQFYLAKSLKANPLDLILGKVNLFRRLELDNWFDLRQELSSGESFFADEKAEKDILLVDLKNLTIDQKAIDFLNNSNTEGYTLFFIRPDKPSQDAEEKKLWTKTGEYVVLKKAEESEKLELARQYVMDLGLDLTRVQIQFLAEQADNFQELIDNLDLVDLADGKPEMLKSLQKNEETQLFMLGFDPQKTSLQALNWYKSVQEEDIQLALSLIFTKLSKFNHPFSKVLLKVLIETDQKMKTRAKIPLTLWWKLFLWKSRQGMS